MEDYQAGYPGNMRQLSSQQQAAYPFHMPVKFPTVPEAEGIYKQGRTILHTGSRKNAHAHGQQLMDRGMVQMKEVRGAWLVNAACVRGLMLTRPACLGRPPLQTFNL